MFIEVTAYTSADQPVKHVAESGEVYMDFDTAMEIIVVTVNAYGNTGSNTQIMLRVVSLKEELPHWSVQHISQEGQPLFRSHIYLCLKVLCPSKDILDCKSKNLCTLRLVSAE